MKIKKKVSKKLIAGIVSLAVIIAGVGTYVGVRYKSYQKMLKYMNITFSDKNVFEYSNDRIDLHAMVENYTGTLSIDPTVVDANKLGVYTAVFTIKGVDDYGAEKSLSYTKFYTIEDTQAPVITLNAESVTITAGDAFDPVSNIASVKDIVDGDLTKADSIAKGSYIVVSNVDVNTAGSYKVTVTAMDANGKSADVEYAVTVNPKPTASSGGSSSGGGSWGGGSSGGSGSSGSGGSSGGGATINGCPIEYYYDQREWHSNVSRIYSSGDEAAGDAGNDSRIGPDTRYGVGTISCGTTGEIYGYFYWWE